MKIPEDYIEFLYWFKTETETYWEIKPNSKADDYLNESWIRGAKWVGLEEDEIEKIESKYNISFSSEHKEFLKILHALDKKHPVEFYDDNDEICVEEDSFFYNWLIDEQEIKDTLSWPYREIFHDVKKGVWLKSWKERPKSENEIEKIFSDWYNKAPKLIPIHAHRFVVSGLDEIKSPVLSVWGTDTIVYGWSMKHYLLNELEGYLDLFESVYDDDDKSWHSKPIKELQEFQNKEWELAKKKVIPYWSELINLRKF